MRIMLKTVWLIVLLTVLCDAPSGGSTNSSSHDLGNSSDSCPTWFVSDGDKCSCGDTLGGFVLCEDVPPQVELVIGYCMTFDEATNSTLAGYCPYSFIRDNKALVLLPIPANISELNGFMCGDVHRQGLFCGRCQDGHYPAVYSYDYECTECSHKGYNWLLFISTTLLPTTILFLAFMVFRINISSPPFAALVLFSQIVSSPEIVRLIPSSVNSIRSAHPGFLLAAQLIMAFHGLWSLEFFPLLSIPSYCLPGVTTTLYALTLQYMIAFYPLLLVGLAYLCIKLHYHNFKPIVFLWRPFHKCLARFNRTWDVKASVINAFATFLLLSYWKIMYTSFNLLLTTVVYSVSGSQVGSWRFYYDASILYFHGEHLPFAIVAILCIAVFVATPPVMLCLYPLKRFQKLISMLGLRGHTFGAFMDLFQGYFKDGTDGNRDWRCFSGAYFLIRIIILTIRITVARVSAYSLLVLLLGLVSLLIANLRPYKVALYNSLDSSVFALLALFHFIFLWDHWQILQKGYIPVGLIIPLYIVAAIPLVIYAGITIWWLSYRWGLQQKLRGLYRRIVAYCAPKHEPQESTQENATVCALRVEDIDSFHDTHSLVSEEHSYHIFK